MNCPICQQPMIEKFNPFCSKTCKNRDLLAWMNESYRVPVFSEEADSDSQLPEETDDLQNY